jgi:hypothetical protein
VLEQLFGIGPGGQDRSLSLSDTPYLIEEWDLPSPLVLLSGQGHYWVALDYRACGPDGNPSVIWLDDAKEDAIRLAPDFRAFIERLTPSADYSD